MQQYLGRFGNTNNHFDPDKCPKDNQLRTPTESRGGRDNYVLYYDPLEDGFHSSILLFTFVFTFYLYFDVY